MAERLVDATARSDAELITAVRVGDIGSYEELYRRHVDAAMSVGRHLTGSRADAEDVVSEAFARVLSALQRGAGPEMAFRPYLLTSVRNAFYDRTRKDKRLDVTDEVPEDLGRVLAAAASSDDDVERRLAAAAFASLPERWQLVLWHTEVEGRSPAEVGPLLGLAPNAVAALAYRAREGLRQAYLNAHIQARPPADCADTVPKLGAYVREDLSNRDRQKVEAHLQDCERCQAIVVELREAGSRLRLALIPLLAGIPAAAYLSGIGAGAGAVGGVAAWGRRVSNRVKELGPVGQVAAAVGAVAAAGVLVVGALAVAQAVTGPGQDETVTAPGAGDGSGQGGGSRGGVGSDAGGGAEGGAGPAASDAPLTIAPPSASPTSAPSLGPAGGPAVSIPGVSPTAPTVPLPPSTVPSPTSATPTSGPITPAPTTPTTSVPTPPTSVPVTTLTVSLGSAGPAYAGLGMGIPVAVGNGGGVAVSLGPGRSAAPALGALLPRQIGSAGQPTIVVPLPTGVTYTGVDNPAWTCATGAASVQCVLPALASGGTSSGLIQLLLAADVASSITLQPTIADGTGPPVAGAPLVISVQPAPAGVTDLFVDHADLALLGNAILTCNPVAVGSCTTARDNPAAAPGQADKAAQRMMWIDLDADPTTFNSSSATLTLPPGAQVLAAQLLWGGTVQPGSGGVAPPDPTGTGTVLLVPPAGGAPAAVAAAAVSTDPNSTSRYLATADVTALVQAGGGGVYTAANLQVATGQNTFGGWALQVVYRDPAAPLRMVALSSNVITVNAGGRASVSLPGLPASTAPRAAVLSFAAVEGDFGIIPERLVASGVSLSNTGNAVDNPFNGSITTPGVRTPAFINNFGFDADQFPITVAPGQTEIALDVSSSLDRFRMAATAISVAL